MQQDRTATSATTSRPRRQKSSKPSIYFRTDSKGSRIYEYVYRDSSGKQRWVSGFRTLKEAEDARGEVMRRIRRGARVEPIKLTFAEFAHTWLDGQTQLRPSTVDRYRWAIDHHLIPQFGRLKLAEISEDVIAGLISDMQAKALKPATVKAVLNVLSLVLGRAVRRGAISHNAVRGLERSERPTGKRRAMRILSRDEIGQLIECTHPDHRALIATLVFCGLRVSEALGLRWSDIDLDGNQLHVRGQLDHKTREHVQTKTTSSTRSVVLMPALGKMLAAHRLASEFSADHDLLFSSTTGTAMNRDNVRSRILHPAVKAAGLDVPGKPKLRTHDLRHCFASLLIAGGASVVFVAAQLGHSSAAVTLNVYAALFDERDHAARMAEILEDGYGNVVETAMRGEARSGAAVTTTEPTSLRGVAGARGYPRQAVPY